jgi:hypothetical protein
MSSTEIQALAALDRPISSITGLQGELDNRAGQSATTVALSLKVDKEGSISLSESTANLLDRVKTPVPSGALFTDSVFNPATDVPNGSLEISQIGGLTAVLGSFKNASDSDIADTVLRNDLTSLETVVEALPPSQILVNGTFLDQARFSVVNAIPQLNVALGMWDWLVRPLWSDLQRDQMRLRHARAGTLALDPSPDCLLYMPCITSTKDLGPGGLHLLHQVDDSGDFGVFAHIPPTLMSDGYTLTAPHKYLLPGRNIPADPLTSAGAGWGSSSTDSWLLEYQLYMPADSFFQILITSDADVSYDAPDRLLFLTVNGAAGTLAVRWDDRTSSGNSGAVINAVDISLPVSWHTFAFQKSAGSNRVYAYHNGVLALSEDITSPLSRLDHFRFSSLNSPVLRELSLRTTCVLPEIPFTSASPVQYSIGDPHLRFNSYQLQ